MSNNSIFCYTICMDPTTQTQQPVAEQAATQQPNDQPVHSPQDERTAPPMPVAKGSPMSKLLWVIVAVVILGLVASVSYYWRIRKGESGQLQKVLQKTEENVKQAQITKMPLATPTPDSTASWSAYTNTKYMYSVKYPTNLTPNEQNTYYHYVEFNPSGPHIL